MTAHAPYWPLATLLLGMVLCALASSAVRQWRDSE